MSLEEMGVIALCLFGGYWGVSLLFHRKGKQRAAPEAEAPQPDPSTNEEEPAWETVLGVGADAGMEEIRRAYQQRIREYHPDKVATLGPELKALAERKSQEINVAYERARRARGDQG